MKPAEVKRYFYELVSRYFSNANVVFGRQSNRAKSLLPLVALIPGNVKRPRDCCTHDINGVPVYYYPSQIEITIDLFTHGAPVGDGGAIITHDDTAVDDLVGFQNYLDSRDALEWCQKHDLAITVNGDVQCLTGVVNDTSYEYRARISVIVYFTQVAVGNTASLSGNSIRYPTGQIDPQTGTEIFAPYEPYEEGTSYATVFFEPDEENALVYPIVEQNSAGGINSDFANEESYYFTEADIEEVIENE